ncbi:hypothetical protein SMICM304S_10861 [Streptomyces microflavus]
MAIVGASGNGKSTVSLLVPRFYDVSHGAVLHRRPRRPRATQASLRSAIGLVPEDSFLFSDTVRSNIAYGFPDATQEQIEQAARAAQAHGFISALPDGYDTTVGKHGLTLSGGQRQRVALARAILTDPRLLLLDDATSAVDARVEHEIHEALKQVMAGRTTLLIAHRRSTLQLADRIAVLDGGKPPPRHPRGAGAHLPALPPSAEPPRRTRRYVPGPPAAAPARPTPTAAGPSSRSWTPSSTPSAASRPSCGSARRRSGTPRSPGCPPPPELLAQVEALPPANWTPPRSTRRAPCGPRTPTDCAGCWAASVPHCLSASGSSPWTPRWPAAAGPDPARIDEGAPGSTGGVGGLRDRPGRRGRPAGGPARARSRITGRTGQRTSTRSA